MRRLATRPGVLALAIGVAAFVVYLVTLAPGLAWVHAGRDGGDLVTAAWCAGVPHPTGYPVWTMLAWLFTKLPFGSVATRVDLFSAVAGAAAAAVLFLALRRMGRDRSPAAASIGAAVGALLFAFSPTFWGQCVVAEVYSLNAFFVALVLWLVLCWRDGDGSLPLAAAAYGLGLGVHVTLVFLAPLILLLLVEQRARLSVRLVAASALALGAGLLVYLYIPLRAGTDPVVNWGGADTGRGFAWLVFGRDYRRYVFALPAAQLWERLEQLGALSWVQFPIPAVPLVLFGLGPFFRRDRRLAAGTVLVVAIQTVYAVGYDVSDWWVYLIPSYLVASVWLAEGAAFVAGATGLGARSRRLVRVGLAALVVLSAVESWQASDASGDREPAVWARESIDRVEPGALILARSDAHTFALWYYHFVEGRRPDVAVVNPLLMGYPWYRRSLAIHEPNAAWPGPDGPPVTVLDLALHSLPRRPVYVTEDDEPLGQLRLTPVGRLWRVSR